MHRFTYIDYKKSFDYLWYFEYVVCIVCMWVEEHPRDPV
jgi:hypothetical protein